ncbi:putative vitamin uptake transporter [Vibrio phage 2.117.O._10N.261.45.E9]|nr:putative vitamin uptake transporter [Vibrio phage 1.117.O._10N.261.45.E9]AUR95470.1 putative vitamin uptake transporter [Vibrio phage 1.207.B._10N.222.51.C2]AUS02361.1 putative vitamin uptake transporter [Vibrio phage 2.117.O._10N.261.45.E9]
MYYIIAYFLLVLGVNIGFSIFPPVDLPLLGFVPPVAFAVGFVFVLRDYAQRAVGHWVFPAMIGATALSYLVSDPAVAIASAAAFLVGETVDWLVYTITKKPFHQRLLISSALAVPVDTLVFLHIANFYGHGIMVSMVISKILASVFIWGLYAKKAQTAQTA